MRDEKWRTSGRRGVSGENRTSAARAGAMNGEVRLRSYQVGAVPLINHLLCRLDFEATLRALAAGRFAAGTAPRTHPRARGAKLAGVARAAASPEDRDDAIALYAEGRIAHRPTARRVLDALEPLRRPELHTVATAASEPIALHDELSPVQRRRLTLDELDPATYGK